MSLLDQVKADIRFTEACQSCINCGVCAAICPAADYFPYDPRIIMGLVIEGNEKQIHDLLSSEDIWYCGQCMSCKPRCPRGNSPGTLISILRSVSIESGLFQNSEQGRMQIRIKRGIGHNILETGYCVHPFRLDPKQHPELGPVWEWMTRNNGEVYTHFDDSFNQEGGRLLRKISSQTLAELKRIFDISGCRDLWNQIEKCQVPDDPGRNTKN